MKTSLFKAAAILTILVTTGTAYCADQPAATSTSTNGVGPKIQFDSLTYSFDRVRAGTKVRHDFVFTNTGDATLEISSVNPGCHCTTVGDWTHKVEPGKTGVIPIQFDSTGFGGPIVRSPSVTCNDKSQPVVQVHLNGMVFKPVDVNPAYVSMSIAPDASEETSAVVHIINNEDEPLQLASPTSSQSNFVAELKTNTPGKNFDLIIKTVPPLAPGTSQARITVESLSTNAQPISVFAMATVQSLVTVSPAQITVPAGPLSSNETVNVLIRNMASHPLVLSEPSVNAKGANPEINVSQPGRAFIASVEFPAGFQAAPGVPMELSIKTDSARFPVIKVPIRQAMATAALPPKPVRVGQ
ncbi:MAG TPA: DUF1573 domain-containing protein [Verrucomicrobiae bacterium]|nr:DUF1573 domain-containing protein [Verrucomicrobiae bacterium]